MLRISLIKPDHKFKYILDLEAANLLYRNGLSGMLINLFTVTLLAFSFIEEQTYNAKIAWWISALVIIFIRVLDIAEWNLHSSKTSRPNGIAGLWRYSIGSTATALVLSFYAWYFLPTMSNNELAITSIVIAAFAGGSTTVLAGSMVMSVLFSAILLIPVSVVCLLSQQTHLNLLGLLGLAYGAIVAISGLKSARFTRDAIKLKTINAQLMDELNNNKSQVMRVNSELREATTKLNEVNHNLELEVQKRTEKITELSHKDSLTGLQNRGAFTQELDHLIELSVEKGNSLALLFVDLDGFKKINDTMGHQIGDRTLVEVAKRIAAFADEKRCGRWGGDEFLVALPYSDQETALSIASAMMTSISQAINVNGNELYMSASIGIALAPVHSLNAEDLIQLADLTMCEQKQSGKHKPRVFSTELKGKIEASQVILEGLQRALEKKQLYLCYQPIQCAKDNTTWSFEALLRWNFDGKFIGPDVFIPLAEKSGLIKEIGAWVLNRACMDAKHWQFNQHAAVSVNVSVTQLMDDGFVRLLDNTLRSTGLSPERLHLEITESTFVENDRKIRDQLEQIQSRNIHVSIDDFGTGYSSLSQLQTLPVNYVKIDKSFVDNIENKGDAIIRATQFIARELNCLTVAEGVETKEQAMALSAMGVDYLQGYYFAKPMRNEDLIIWQNPISNFPN